MCRICSPPRPGPRTIPATRSASWCPFRPAARWTGRRASSRRKWASAWASRSSSTTSPAPAPPSAARSVAKAAPDGYTLLLASQTNAISATLYRKLGFRPDRRLRRHLADRPRARRAGGHPVVPGQDRGRTGGLREGEAGRGQLRLVGQRQRPAPVHGAVRHHGRHQADARALPRQRPGHHRPAGRHVPMSMPGTAGMVAHIKAGKLRALAVSGARRSPQLPDVPTLAESGLPGFEAYVWLGLLAPKGTPPAIVERLHTEVMRGAASSRGQGLLQQPGIETVGSTPGRIRRLFPRGTRPLGACHQGHRRQDRLTATRETRRMTHDHRPGTLDRPRQPPTARCGSSCGKSTPAPPTASPRCCSCTARRWPASRPSI